MLNRVCTGLILSMGLVAPVWGWADDTLKGLSASLPGDVSGPVTTFSDVVFVTLDITAGPGEAFTTEVALPDETLTLNLWPHSVRAADFQLKVQIEDGSIVNQDPSQERTLRGTVVEYSESQVAGSLLETGLEAKIVLSDEITYWLEPAQKFFSGSGENEYIVYLDGSVSCSGGSCGVEDLGFESGIEIGGMSSRGAACGTGLCIAQIACDADVEYFQDYGTVNATENRIESVINTINLQYESFADITHVITAIIVRTAEPDPYSSTNYLTLLNQFRNHWLANQGGITRDLAHLFTGKELDGSVVGVAYTIGGVCTTSGYSLAQSDFSGSFACVTDLSAHENGHIWALDHCPCPNFTMNASITCKNQFSVQYDLAQITAHRDSRTCLDGGGPPVEPPNNACANAITISDGVTVFDTTGATTDGATLPPSCDEEFGVTLDADIWYNYTATCTGTATVSTCNDASFDTRLAMYAGTGCPAGTLVACNDDGDGCALTSLMMASVTSGSSYKIRLGSFDGTTGTGNLTVSCAANLLTPIQMSFYSATVVPDGVGTVQNEDIVTFDRNTGVFSLYFDGSDVGLASFTLDALAFLPNGDLLISLNVEGNLTGLIGGPNGTLVDDSDIIEFTPTSLGSTTAGTWTFFFDGSDVDLTLDDEDIDALSFAPDGRIVVSTVGIPMVTGLTGLQDEDLIAFTATSLGSVTAGTWGYYFDGSDVGLSTTSNEDVDVVSIDDAENITLSTVGLFSVTGVSGDDEDLFNFDPTTLGTATSGVFSAFFDGVNEGLPATTDIGSAEMND